MASSDDEAEALPQFVSNYHFVDDKDEPVSFSLLPIQWDMDSRPDSKKIQFFLHGIADDGLQKIYKHVIAWRFDISNVKPEIAVLSKENNWIKLLKPRKSFEDTIRSILVTVNCLHFAKRNPETSSKSLWDHLSKTFSSYESRPSQNDLIDHMDLITEAVGRDNALANSKFLHAFLKEKPRKNKVPEEGIKAVPKSFIVDDNDIDNYSSDGIEEDDSDDDDDLFDSVCAICDNGGDILCCEGKCMRSFHATEEAGVESLCDSLGFLSKEEAEAIPVFLCKNCEHDQHQCFVCGKLGSSNNSSSAEVFRCASATCGHFYHPHCVAKLLHLDDEVSSEELEKKIARGESFLCPAHKCSVCKGGEKKKVPDEQFAVCRRCPTSYHRKCLPKKIVFDDEGKKGIMIRAWEGLLPNRILIYCLKHEIDRDLKTPIRNHIKFPGVEEKKSFLGNMKTSAEGKKRRQTSELLEDRENPVSKKRIIGSGKSSQGRFYHAASKQNEESYSVKVGGNKNITKKFSGLNTTTRVPKKDLKSSDVVEDKAFLGDGLFAQVSKGSERLKSGKQDTPDDELNKAATLPPKNLSNEPPTLDCDSERRISQLMKDAASSITLEDIMKKHKVPSTYANSSKYAADKNITVGKLEGSIQAVRTALQQLEKGGSNEDAQAVCEPEVLSQIYKWKIVNKLHPYVREGDTVVDFCCGANDFSILMRRKLEETGKKCLYKNYDFIQPKNDHNFERRDWMTVQPHELPSGSQLILGLNPPFGVKAVLANKFIDKALEFNPKLLILIVPPETQRLDEKQLPYDLIWEDDRLLSGKSFYLPGSVDVYDKQMEQWNTRPPVLYLWSRPDWTAEHKAIAEKYGHIFRQEEPLECIPSNSIIPESPMGNHDDSIDESMLITDDLAVQTDNIEGFIDWALGTERHNESSTVGSGDGRSCENHDCEKNQPKAKSGNQPKEKSVKRQRGKKKRRRGKGEISAENKLDGGRERRRGMPPPNNKVDENTRQHFELRKSGTDDFCVHLETTNAAPETRLPDNISRRYSLNVDDNYSSATNRWSGSVSPASNYGIRNMEEQFMGRMRENTDSFGYRSPYTVDMEERLRRETQARFYGQNPDPSVSNSLVGQDLRYGQIGSLPPLPTPYGINISATQRYAPRLDEWNSTRMSGFGPEPPFYDPRAPPPGHRAGRMGFSPCPAPPPPPGGSIGFAPGPHQTLPGGPLGFVPSPSPQQSFPSRSSGGWLND
ncbi:protein ENHANCED DOWNY MILDEW 2 isoform X3 [Ziziphus jujuba]|uniref:Protein ENHANCED DOWNY MILDEW 2 isoform X3 n=1 Tax=Ziziphus jujuba TaxID=326968 RepID=A0ABM3IHT2_ZIZJJ|nr:protein ENHANCED DOWNY MILDEW 2 isoform X3 [Ziziphus jujuba]